MFNITNVFGYYFVSPDHIGKSLKLTLKIFNSHNVFNGFPIQNLVVFHRVCLRLVCLRSDDAKLIDNFVFHIKKANFIL